jgi:hypothetical protein
MLDLTSAMESSVVRAILLCLRLRFTPQWMHCNSTITLFHPPRARKHDSKFRNRESAEEDANALKTQAAITSPEFCNSAAISPGVRRIPEPTVSPTITAIPKPTPTMRSRCPFACTGREGSLWTLSCEKGGPLVRVVITRCRCGCSQLRMPRMYFLKERR